ncbi:TonB-dependent siderophore receptor [Vreelandella titanicae]|uniref:TonB-dependent siderophore receptor n=1 Tax=Vreelandella titanicae TaxID=664683 RepID=UPI001F391417|nr:TonB-dependent siderophore receptor [Halomonas titanicae]MCE7516970.1 TonB-dependent siderophore receptor [Halomonas titanicae]
MNYKEKCVLICRGSLVVALVTATSGHAVAEEEEQATELNEILVTAEREGPLGPDAGYRANRSMTGTKTDTPISETPRSVSSVTRNMIEDQGAQTLSDILMYIPGVSPVSYGVHDALAGDIFRIRGVNARDYGYGTYRDGLRVQPNAYTTSAEPYGLERVEVIKGPTSVLYGENVPGGLVNLVSKRPTDTPQGEVNLSYGSHDRRQASMDVSGPLTDDGSVRGRMVVLVRDADTQTDNVSDDRIYLAPSIAFDLSDRDTLTLLAQYQKDDTELQTGLPAAGTLLKHPNGQLDTSHSLGHPDWDVFDREFWSAGYEYEHLFNEQWSFRQNARYLSASTIRKEIWWSFPPAGFAGAAGDGYDSFLAAYGRDRDDNTYMASIDNQLVGHFDAGGWENTVLFGAGYDRSSYDAQQFISQRPDEFVMIDIFDPEWTSPPKTSTRATDAELKQDLAGVYSQIQAKRDGWIGMLGGRYDWAESQIDDRVNRDGSFEVTDREFTWQAGVMYQFDNGVSPYMSYATSFVPVQQVQSESNSPFEPITGQQVEAGFKYEPENHDVMYTLAYYELQKENDVTYSDGGVARQIGETESKGVELEARGDVTDNLSVSASYAYTDARITEDAGSYVEGKQMVSIPRHQGAVWANYQFHGDSLLDGLETGLGVRYLGSSYGYPESTYGTVKTESTTLVDMTLGYQFNPNWRASVNARNLLGKDYIAECNNAGRCYWGSERSVIGTVSYKW